MGEPYLQEIEEFFVTAIGKGLMLRPQDVDVVREWEERGVPVAVVKRGILNGVKRFVEGSDPTRPLPSALRYYRTFVEAEFDIWCRAVRLQRTYDRGRGGRGDGGMPDVVERGIATLREYGRKACEQTRKECFEAAVALLRDLVGQGLGPVEALEAAEGFVVKGLLAGMPQDVRARIEAEVKAFLEEAKRRGLGAIALKDLEREQMRALVAKETGFQGLVAAVVENAP